MTLETKPITPKNQEKTRYYDDLQRVGPKKPLGFLPLAGIRIINHEDPLVLQQQAIKQGKIAIIVPEKDCMVYSGALCVADTQALKRLLESRSGVLETYGWPKDPEAFIRKVVSTSALPKTPLCDLIADAFADYTNPERTDVGD